MPAQDLATITSPWPFAQWGIDTVGSLPTTPDQRMANLYNRHIKSCTFLAKDLVLRRVFENIANLAAGKFQPNWEGPYVIVRVGPTRLYALNKLDEALVSRMWNVMHLQRYYQ